MRTPRLRPWALALLGAALVACGGSYGGGGGGSGGAGGVDVVNAFPFLSFSHPLFLTFAPGDATRLFVATQDGVVYEFPNDTNAFGPATFLDLQLRTDYDGGEQGLLGLAFDPGYAVNGFFYVNYNPSGGTRRTNISRFHAIDADTADDTSETVILTFDQPAARDNHKGGWIGFGPDAKLYIATGDGGGTGDPDNNAQNLNVLLGKILRINADGTIPADNPFVGVSGSDEIWAYGLRNPFRASFDRATPRLFVGDVGQDNYEEMGLVTRGGNYGWRKFEGNHVYNAGDPDPGNAVAPVLEYAHGATSRCTIIGGYVYRGAALSAFAGRYFYADFCTGELWSVRTDGGDNRAHGTVPGNPTSFGEGPDGELYVTSFNGSIYKLVAP